MNDLHNIINSKLEYQKIIFDIKVDPQQNFISGFANLLLNY